MNAKHQFKYTFNETDMEEFSPVDITMDVPGDVTLTQMLYNFERYLQACGFVFDGRLDFVEDGCNLQDEEPIWPADYDGYENEPAGGCMADFDKECGCNTTSSPLESKNEKLLREWNEGIAKLDKEQKMKCYEEALKISESIPFDPLYKKVGTLSSEAEREVKKNNWVHGICNPPSPDWKKKK